MKIDAYGISDVGLVRTNNEDSFCFDAGIKIFILADGMGGHNAGEVASAKAVEIVFSHFSEAKRDKKGYESKKKKDMQKDLQFVENLLSLSIIDANMAVYLESISNNEVSGMGTTLEVLSFYYGKYYIGHIGDSRIYLLRDKNLTQITEDHSVVNILMSQHLLSKDDARHHPYSHILTNALGVQAEVSLDILSDDYYDGDIFLLCSDGLSDMLSDDSIQTILKRDDISLTKKGELLVDAAKYSSGIDNITLILVEIIEK